MEVLTMVAKGLVLIAFLGLLTGCQGQLSTHGGGIVLTCEHNERACVQRCQDDYVSADPLQARCIQRCYEQANQCRVSAPAE
ncbi:hypothetical protein CWB99_08055 [Pseudoalteromonas rubra]|uniref:Uncharacterized protein n=1 Tax=Pseudoalteromonas rubra TaxID=43658 RepID=A0A5S3WN03_9GAMM|nr:hypothetical protein [Pseudoalteromonas rubra]TMP29552.1 hypothetical protein CWB99_08055 [Pseudoalteromonas rubra]TMP35146.1 hypothetical protein CWC00_05020 [Pseudoalteromonas rubra]